jgi:hypothetical protein
MPWQPDAVRSDHQDVPSRTQFCHLVGSWGHHLGDRYHRYGGKVIFGDDVKRTGKVEGSGRQTVVSGGSQRDTIHRLHCLKHQHALCTDFERLRYKDLYQIVDMPSLTTDKEEISIIQFKSQLNSIIASSISIVTSLTSQT